MKRHSVWNSEVGVLAILILAWISLIVGMAACNTIKERRAHTQSTYEHPDNP